MVSKEIVSQDLLDAVQELSIRRTFAQEVMIFNVVIMLHVRQAMALVLACRLRCVLPKEEYLILVIIVMVLLICNVV